MADSATEDRSKFPALEAIDPKERSFSQDVLRYLRSHPIHTTAFLLSLRIPIARAMPVGQSSDTIGSSSKPTSSKLQGPGRIRSSFTRDIGTDMLLFAIAVLVFIITVAVATSFRRLWPYLSPAMTFSSIMFVILRNDPEVRPEIAWMMFGVWASATTSYMWTRKKRMSSGNFYCYFVMTFLTTGMCMYTIAIAQDSSLRDGLVTAIPPCAAFSAYACSRLVHFRINCSPVSNRHQSKNSGLSTDDSE